MTSPSDPSVRVIQTAPDAPVANDEVVETAQKLVRARAFAKTSFAKVGLPVLIGSASALAVDIVRNRRNQDDLDVVNDDSSDTDTE